MPRGWTKDEEQTVRKLSELGKRPAEIAAALTNRTRNMVIGYMHRKGISTNTGGRSGVGRRPKGQALFPKQKTAAAPAPKPVAFVPATVPAPMVQEPHGFVHISNLKSGMCRNVEYGFFYCGKPVVHEGSSWCKHHHSLYLRTMYAVRKEKEDKETAAKEHAPRESRVLTHWR